MGFFGQKCYLGLVDLYMKMYACSTYIYMHISCMYIYTDVCIKSYLHTIYMYIYIYISKITRFVCIPFSAKSKSTKTTGPKTSEVYVSTG